MSDQPNKWLSLSVQDFFGGLNWQGKPQVSTSKNNSNNDSNNDSTQSLTISVAEFFSQFVWEVPPEVGALPNNSSVSSSQNTLDTEEDVTIDDLVNLF